MSNFSEDDARETEMTYGKPNSREAYVFVGIAWAGYSLVALSYLSLYYFPDLAEWIAW